MLGGPPVQAEAAPPASAVRADVDPAAVPFLALASPGATPDTTPRLLPPPAFWAPAGVVLGASLLADRWAREELFVERPDGLAGVARLGNHLGNPAYSLPVLAALYATGRLSHHPALSVAARDAVAGLIATGVANGALKAGVGRARPYTGADGDEFHPFTLDNRWQAFPSGHTAVAFSLATMVAEETHGFLPAALAYGAAGVVGWSRIYGDNHWASDVVAGAVTGTVATRAAIRWLHARARADGQAGVRVGFAPDAVVVTIPTP